MIKLHHALMVSVAAFVLAGCGERDQTTSQGPVKKTDSKAWEGAQATAYTVPGWKAGDRDSWETQMKQRAQQGQNEYTRVAPTSGASAKP